MNGERLIEFFKHTFAISNVNVSLAICHIEESTYGAIWNIAASNWPIDSSVSGLSTLVSTSQVWDLSASRGFWAVASVFYNRYTDNSLKSVTLRIHPYGERSGKSVWRRIAGYGYNGTKTKCNGRCQTYPGIHTYLFLWFLTIWVGKTSRVVNIG